MSPPRFYELKEPTGWAPVPRTFSYSSLHSLKSCPRKWQFINSQWGEYSRFPERPQPAAIEGRIIHEGLDLLAKEVGRIGRPPIGSAEFAAALERCRFWDFFAEQVNEWNSRLKTHPRAGPRYVLRTNPRDLANQAVRLFREQYRPAVDDENSDSIVTTVRQEPAMSDQTLLDALRDHGAVTEVLLQHPRLPLVGVLDLVSIDAAGAITVVDFKTGARRATHEEQLRIYALLWWRATGDPPSRVLVQYLDSSWQATLNESELMDIEIAVERDIRWASEELVRRPAAARVGENCLFCPVRPRCNEGWMWGDQVKRSTRESEIPISLQLIVASNPTATGFLARQSNGEEVAIVFDVAVGRTLPPIGLKDRLRIVDAASDAEGNEIQLLPWTEIYLL